MEIIDQGTHIRLKHQAEVWDDIPKPIRLTRQGNRLIINTITGGENTKATHTPVIDVTTVTSPVFSSVEELISIILSWLGVDGIPLCVDKQFGDAVWENVSDDDYIKTFGYTTLGLFIKQEFSSVTTPKIRVMLMRSEDPASTYEMELDDLYIKDLFLSNKEIFFQFELDGLIPYVQIQSYSGDKGDAGDLLTIHYTLK